MIKILLLIFAVGGIIIYFLLNNRQQIIQRIFDKELNKQFTIVKIEEGHSPDIFHLGTDSYTIVLKDKDNLEFDGVWASFKKGVEYTPKDTILKLYSQRSESYKLHTEIAKKFYAIAPTIIKTAHVHGMDMKEQMIIFLPKDISQNEELSIYKKMTTITIDLETEQNINYGQVFSVCKQNLSSAEKEHIAKGTDFYWNADYKIEVVLKPNTVIAEDEKVDVNKDLIFYKYKNDQWTVNPIQKFE